MYLNYIQQNGLTLGADEGDNTFGWDNKHVGARILLSKVKIKKQVISVLILLLWALVYLTIIVEINIWFQYQAFLVQKVQSLHDYKGQSDNFICSLIPQSQYTPGTFPSILYNTTVEPRLINNSRYIIYLFCESHYIEIVYI